MANINGWVAAAKAKAGPIGRSMAKGAGVGIGVAVGGMAAYSVGKATYDVINRNMFEPYSLANPRTVTRGAGGPNDPMQFAPAIRQAYSKGLTPGQFADNGDLTLSLNNLRRG